MGCKGATKAVLKYESAGVSQVTSLQQLLLRVEAAICAAGGAVPVGPKGADPGLQLPQLHPSSPCKPQVGASYCTLRCVLRCMHHPGNPAITVWRQIVCAYDATKGGPAASFVNSQLGESLRTAKPALVLMKAQLLKN